MDNLWQWVLAHPDQSVTFVLYVLTLLIALASYLRWRYTNTLRQAVAFVEAYKHAMQKQNPDHKDPVHVLESMAIDYVKARYPFWLQVFLNVAAMKEDIKSFVQLTTDHAPGPLRAIGDAIEKGLDALPTVTPAATPSGSPCSPLPVGDGLPSTSQETPEAVSRP